MKLGLVEAGRSPLDFRHLSGLVRISAKLAESGSSAAMARKNDITLREQGLTVQTEQTGDVITAQFVGTGELPSTEPLTRALEQLHAAALASQSKEVVVDFHKLVFMNTSCFRSFITWVTEVQELPAESQYKIRMLSNAAIQWQRRSLQALRCLATDIVTIQSSGA